MGLLGRAILIRRTLTAGNGSELNHLAQATPAATLTSP